jgi:hypothetical protein
LRPSKQGSGATMNNFKLWQVQPVTFSSGDCISRMDYIPQFTADIRKFVDSFGYKFTSTWTTLTVARWLYTIHIRDATYDMSSFPYEPIQHRNTIEDEAHFNGLFCEKDIDKFFEAWKECSDLNPDTCPGITVRSELMRFIWNYIDLDISYQGQYIYSILYPESESDTESCGKQDGDYYVKDSTEGYHG